MAWSWLTSIWKGPRRRLLKQRLLLRMQIFGSMSSKLTSVSRSPSELPLSMPPDISVELITQSTPPVYHSPFPFPHFINDISARTVSLSSFAFPADLTGIPVAVVFGRPPVIDHTYTLHFPSKFGSCFVYKAVVILRFAACFSSLPLLPRPASGSWPLALCPLCFSSRHVFTVHCCFLTCCHISQWPHIASQKHLFFCARCFLMPTLRRRRCRRLLPSRLS